jgi:carbamoyltransferase
LQKPVDIAGKAAQALADGQVLAWFQGRMEYGPRSLGNRSLLAAATDPAMPGQLNARLHRSDFMPFAPILLEEDAATWLCRWKPDHIASRFMTITYQMAPEYAPRVPAVVHVDGTARPQVLRREDQPMLHEVLLRYRALTGIPLLINTSFNMHEEPIVCSPADALAALEQGAADILVIGGFWVERTDLVLNPISEIK